MKRTCGLCFRSLCLSRCFPFLSLVHVIQFLEFNDEPSKRYYKISVCTMHHMYIYIAVHKHGICFRNSMSVLVFLPFGAQWITIRNFVFEHISSDVLPFYAPQKSYSFKTVTNFTLCFRAKISRALLWNGIECACIFTEQWTEHSYFSYFHDLFQVCIQLGKGMSIVVYEFFSTTLSRRNG